VHAAAINPSDVGAIEGRFPEEVVKFPLTPGRDFAGEVTTGPAQWIGKRVWGTGGLYGFALDGSHAEYMLVKTEGLAEMPKTLGYGQVTACGVGFLTAECMIERAAVKAGEYALVLGRPLHPE
jgi:NADPH:quinone reductase-like Zn-dependent oxidoreductase